MNEEGLPIMEIREELPSNYDEEQAKKKKKNLIESRSPRTDLPESVVRARQMMKEADEKINQKKQDADNKALFDLLRELEQEEEEEEEGGESADQVKPTGPSVINNRKMADALRHNDDDEEDDQDSLSDATDDDEDGDRYDTEISENMFDRFGDDEEYPLDGVVDQEDFTCYDEQIMPPQIIPASSIREVVEDEEEYEKSTPKVITKRKPKPAEEQEEIPVAVETKVQEKPVAVAEKAKVVEEKPKKTSKFKLAQQEKKAASSSVVMENPPSPAIVEKEQVEEKTPAVVVQETNNKPKKFSKFKLLRQQQQDQPRKKSSVSESPVETKVKEVVVSEPIQPPPPKQEAEQEQEHYTEDIETMLIEPKKKPSGPVENNGIPTVASTSSVSSSSNRPKKMSRFKLSRQQSQQPKEEEEEETVTPVKVERIKPKRTVTWDSNNTVRDHDNTLAPSVVSELTSYSQPMKTAEQDAKKKAATARMIRSPADIFHTLQQTQQDYVDDYPSLDDSEQEGGRKKVDLNELIKVAKDSQEAFWRPNDGSKALIPMVKSSSSSQPTQDKDDNEEDQPEGLIVARKSKLDNKIMKGAVMERDLVPQVDLDELEQDMDLREVTSSYHQMRQNMLASTGGFSFAPKPEFEVFDEELPLPKKKQDQAQEGEEEEEEEERKPKKMSRFKAARLGMRMDQDNL